MLELKFKGVTAAFDFSFFAAVALLTLLSGNYALLGLAACLWHETGHLIAMKLSKIPVKMVVFYGAGIKIVPDKLINFTGFWSSFTVLISGSAANFIAAVLLYMWGTPAAELFAAINLVIGLFNLLPLRYFDGGKLLVLMIRQLCAFSTACLLERFFKWLNVFLIMAVLIIFSFAGKGNFTLYATLCYLLVSSVCADHCEM